MQKKWLLQEKPDWNVKKNSKVWEKINHPEECKHLSRWALEYRKRESIWRKLVSTIFWSVIQGLKLVGLSNFHQFQELRGPSHHQENLYDCMKCNLTKAIFMD